MVTAGGDLPCLEDSCPVFVLCVEQATSAAVDNALDFVAHLQPSSPVIRLGNGYVWGWWHLHAGWPVLIRKEKIHFS